MAETIDLHPFTKNPVWTDPDFPSAAQQRVAQQIDQNFREHGYLFLSRSGLTADDVHEAFSQTSALFRLSDAHKCDKLYPFTAGGNLGYSAVHTENLNHERPPDILEGFNLHPPSLHPTHVWNLPPTFIVWAEAFWSKGEEKVQMAMKTVVRLVHYPPCDFVPGAADDPSIAVCCAEHSDFGVFTLLFTDSAGLQVLDGDGSTWRSVQPPVPPVAIVNTGVLLQRLSNGHWKAVLHRVIAENREQTEVSRQSVVVFVNPRDDVVFDPIVSDGNERKFDAVSAEQYLQWRIDHSTGEQVDGLDPPVWT